MQVKLIQMDIEWGNPIVNRQRASEFIRSSQGADLYVLPEMFSTGFATNPTAMAETDAGTLQWMQQMAAETNAAVAGSVAVLADDDTFRNRFYFVKPDGTFTWYDKRHLFTYGGEHLNYTAGNERTIVEWRGVRFLLQVCYDLRFPVWSRNSSGDDGYDCILYVASWPESRQRVWNALLVARAIENQCYVCGVNRIGNDPACVYAGGTMAVDAYGRIVAETSANEAGVCTIDLNIEKLEAFRNKFPVLKDAD